MSGLIALCVLVGWLAYLTVAVWMVRRSGAATWLPGLADVARAFPLLPVRRVAAPEERRAPVPSQGLATGNGDDVDMVCFDCIGERWEPVRDSPTANLNPESMVRDMKRAVTMNGGKALCLHHAIAVYETIRSAGR